MEPIKIFISSVQKEFETERKLLAEYIEQDALLGRYFHAFLFENIPSADTTTANVYLSEVEKSDIYLGLVGAEYGLENADGVSATELEYNTATKNGCYRLIYVKQNAIREDKENKFLNKISQSLIRRKFNDYSDLQVAVYASLVRYLEEKEFLRLMPFDASFHKFATISDIDSEKVRSFVGLAQEKRNFPIPFSDGVEKVIKSLNLMSDDGRLTNAALLLFAKEPQKWFVTSEVKCAQFYGTVVEKPLPALQVYRGNVFELIEQTVAFVLSRINARVGERDKSASVDIDYEIPKSVVREAIVNAVTHRDYTSNASIQVMLFSDRLEIWNPGHLPLGLTIEKLEETHSSRPTNPILAHPIYLAGYIEHLGTGTTDMMKHCKDVGLQVPVYQQEEDFRVIIKRPNATQVTTQVTTQATTQATTQVTTQVAKLLCCLKDKELGAMEMMSKLGLNNRSYFYKKYLKPALILKLIVPVDSNSNSPTQKYKLTDLGNHLY